MKTNVSKLTRSLSAIAMVATMGIGGQALADSDTARDAVVHAQFGYPGADSGPYGAAAGTNAVGAADYKLPFQQGALSGQTGSNPAPVQINEGAAIRAQFGYPGGDSGPYGAASGNFAVGNPAYEVR